MELDLARLMGTDSGADEGQAAAEVLAKFATDNNIDLSALSDEDLQGLWESLSADDGEEKTAGDGDDGSGGGGEEPDADDAELARLAVAEWSEKQAAAGQFAEKMAEADAAGRVMARAYVEELGELAGVDKEAGKLDGAKALAQNAGKLLKNKKVQMGLGGAGVGALGFGAGRLSARNKQAMPNVGAALKRLGDGAKRVGAGSKNMLGVSDMQSALKAHRAGDSALRNRAALKGGAKALTMVGLGAGARYGVNALKGRGNSKQASAIDEIAEREAVKLAAQNDYDAEEAVERILAISTLGLPESEKVAAAQSPELAVEIRALEYLEAAGYPVE